MAALRQIVAQLRKQEKQLARQLAGIKDAISSLEFGGPTVPEPFRKRRTTITKRKRRKFSAATIAKMRAAQRARWAKVKGKVKWKG